MHYQLFFVLPLWSDSEAMALKRSEISVGQSYEEVLVEDLKRTQLVMYSGASGDYNPLHTDEVYTREAAGYPSVFAHGMLTMGMTGRVVTNFVGAANVRSSANPPPHPATLSGGSTISGGITGFVHWPAIHTSSVHGSPSSQLEAQPQVRARRP